jgi:uncharacterized protein with von Willebrand factor type A (vWA) domain
MSDLLGNLFGRTSKIEKRDKNTVRRSKMDDGIFDNMRDQAELFRNSIERAPELDTEGEGSSQYVPHWDDLMGDVFKSLHTYEEPAVLDANDVLPSREVNRRVMQRIIGSDDFNAARPITKHAEIESAFTTIGMADELRDTISNEMNELAQEAKEAEKAEKQIERMQERADNIRDEIKEQGGDATDEQKQGLQEAAQRKSNARQRLADSAQKMNDMPMTVGADAGLQRAAEQGKKDAKLISSIPGLGKGEQSQLKPDEALRLAQMFKDNPDLMKIAEMLGRLMRDMKFKRARRITGGTEEVVDVELGNDLANVLPAELMKLRHPLMKLDFIRRYHERALLQYELRGTAEAGLGPLVIAVDESYSMKGQRTVWAKAVCLALISIARKEKRDAAVISYASEREQEMFLFKHAEAFDPDVVVGMAGHNFGGGTDATPAVKMALDLTEKDVTYTRADLVIITDGEDNFQDDDKRTRDELKNRGVRMHGVMVGANPSEYLNEMCETLVSAYDLAGANEATDALAANIS